MLYGAYGFKDTHGMTGEFMRGFDGWVYCCHGFSNTSAVKSRQDTALTMQSGNVYRIKPDGSRIEVVTRGQVNPFGLTFDPLGNLYSCDCHSRPIYQLLKGAYYPSFGKPHDGLGYGPEMLTHDHGSTAIAGITYYAADQFPPEYRDNIFIGNVVTNRINRDRLEAHGSTYKGIAMPDFVKCDDPWFRPVDIKLGPDGALYVADFYNRIIGHYEVPLDHPGRDRERGRIWRIVYRGPAGGQKPRPFGDLTQVSAADLLGELDNPNLMVRMQAMEQVLARPDGDLDVAGLLNSKSPTSRAHGVWIMERKGKLEPAALAKAAHDPDRLVRVHAVRTLAERRVLTGAEREIACGGLKDADAFVQRAAAQALGAHPDRSNIAPLLSFRHQVPPADTHLLHVVRMALRDQLRDVPFADETFSEKDSRALADVCLGVHNAESARFLQRHLEKFDESMPTMQSQVHYITRYSKQEDGAWALQWVRQKYHDDIGVQGQVLKTVHQASQERGRPLGKAEHALAQELAAKLLAGDSGRMPIGIELAGLFKLPETQGALLSIVQNLKADKTARKNAAGALLAIDPLQNVPVLGKLINATNEPVELREQVAGSLAATGLPEAHTALVKVLELAPARLQTAIALALAGSTRGGEKLFEAVAAGKASARLLQEPAIGVRLKQAKMAHFSERLTQLTKGLPTADQRIHKIISQRRGGYERASAEPAVGGKIFEKHCAACHQIANKGAKIGPQLDGIGVRGLERILEDTLDPNRNVDQAFRSTTLVLSDGRLVTGLLLRQDGTVLVLADNTGKEVRVPAAEVLERLVSPLSPMPANFAEQIPEGDFYHLLAFLLAQRSSID